MFAHINIGVTLFPLHVIIINYKFYLQDSQGNFWCSTKVQKKRFHIGGKGNWGNCQMWSYTDSCTLGGKMTKVLDYLNNVLGVTGTNFDGHDRIGSYCLML